MASTATGGSGWGALAEQDALLRGGAVGDGIDLFGVSGSEGRDPSAAGSAGSDRQQVACRWR